MTENPNKLKVGIMDKGWYTTIEIDPNDKLDIDKVIEDYLQHIKNEILVDLQVGYKIIQDCYEYKYFKVEDFDKAVEFLKIKNNGGVK